MSVVSPLSETPFSRSGQAIPQCFEIPRLPTFSSLRAGSRKMGSCGNVGNAISFPPNELCDSVRNETTTLLADTDGDGLNDHSEVAILLTDPTKLNRLDSDPNEPSDDPPVFTVTTYESSDTVTPILDVLTMEAGENVRRQHTTHHSAIDFYRKHACGDLLPEGLRRIRRLGS